MNVSITSIIIVLLAFDITGRSMVETYFLFFMTWLVVSLASHKCPYMGWRRLYSWVYNDFRFVVRFLKFSCTVFRRIAEYPSDIYRISQAEAGHYDLVTELTANRERYVSEAAKWSRTLHELNHEEIQIQNRITARKRMKSGASEMARRSLGDNGEETADFHRHKRRFVEINKSLDADQEMLETVRDRIYQCTKIIEAAIEQIQRIDEEVHQMTHRSMSLAELERSVS